MSESQKTISVIGAGSWGTALAQVLAEKGIAVKLWARREEQASEINMTHTNSRYLPDAVISPSIHATSDINDALQGAEACVLVTPSSNVRDACVLMEPFVREDLPIVVCSKGIEQDSGLLMTQIVADVLGNGSRTAVLSGPTHAEEVVRSQPSAAVVAGTDGACVDMFADLFRTPTFRTYASDDPIGVELCSAFKNVIAIAVGISYGLGFGDNTAAMLITRGLAEMGRAVTACGGQAITCMGLAGAGDMVVTCMSRHSRNRRFGEDYIAKGRTLDDFTADTHMVVEGAVAAKTLQTLPCKCDLDLPLTDTVYQIIWEHADLGELKEALIARPGKQEFYGF